MARPDLNEVYSQDLRSQAAAMLRERGLPIDGDNLQRAMMLLSERPDIGDDIAAAQSPQMSSQLLHYIDSGSTSAPAQSSASTKADAAVSEPTRGEKVPVPQQKPSRNVRSNDDTGTGEDVTLEGENEADTVVGKAAAAQAGNTPSSARRPIEDAIEQQLGSTEAAPAAVSNEPAPNAGGEPMNTDMAPPQDNMIRNGLVALLAALGMRAKRPSQAVMVRNPGFAMRGGSATQYTGPVRQPRQLENTNIRRFREGQAERNAARNDPRASDMEGGY